MNKNFLIAALIAFCTITAFFSCHEKETIIIKEQPVDPEEEPLPPMNPNQEAVADLIVKAGRIATLPEKNITTLVDSAKSDKLDYYTDEASGLKYKGYSYKTTTHHSIVNNPMEFVTLDPWDILWPGALIQGKSLTDGIPASIPIFSKRKPGRIYLSLVSGNQNMDTWYKEVPLSGAFVTQAMNELLEKHLNANPARTAFEIETVTSVEEMALKLGVNLKLFGSKLNQNFGGNWSDSKSYVAVKLNQIFFTMAYEGPDGGIVGTFTDDITPLDLKYYTGPDNPICYVSSVSYGRSYIMLYESRESRRTLELAVKAAFAGQEASASVDRKQTFNEAKCKMVQLGGDPVAGLETVFGDYEKLRKFVTDGAVVSAHNIGVPISYKLSHLLDNSTVRLSNTLEYDVTTQTFLPAVPKNNVTIDIYDVIMPPPQSKREISNYSAMILRAVNVYQLDSDGTKIYDYLVKKPNIQNTKNNGASIPIFKTLNYLSVPHDSRIRIEAQFYAINQTYKPGTQKEEDEFTLIQDFEFDKNKNVWRPVQQNPNPFEKLTKHIENFGGATMDFTLNYRFYCDGIIYPIPEKN